MQNQNSNITIHFTLLFATVKTLFTTARFLLFFSYSFLLTIFSNLILRRIFLGLARPTIYRCFSQRCKVLLSTHRMHNYIASEVTKFLSLNVIRQVYKGHFLIVFPGSSTQREHFSTASMFSFQRHTAKQRTTRRGFSYRIPSIRNQPI